MQIGVKYCGGCNSRYDRTGLVARLKQELGSGVEWVNAGTAEDPMDFVLVVCGCTAACAEHRNLNGARGKLVVDPRLTFDAVLEQLQTLKNNR